LTLLQILSFDGYFTEKVPSGDEDSIRVHHCIINYFVEDGSILVKEPKDPNSGYSQGVIIKRQKIPKPDSKSHYTAQDFSNGANVVFFGKNIRITSCDFLTQVTITANS
jgi:hypothetical protein